jgi:uncharacterized protein YndB with AHSA1/START domain
MSEQPSPYAQRPAPERFTQVINGHTLRIERDLPGPIERVWSYLTTADGMERWIARCEIPSVVGAEFSWQWSGETGGRFDGRVRVFDPPHVLEYAWVETGAPSGAVRDSIVRFELQPRGDRVHLRLLHTALPDTNDARTSFGTGWHAHVDVLEAVLSGIDGPDANARYDVLEPFYLERAAATAS